MNDKIKLIMSNLFKIKISEINDDSSMSNIELWDSLLHINLIIELEAEFKCTFSSDEIVKMVTFKKISSIIKKK